MNLVIPVNVTGKDSGTNIYTRMLKQYWGHVLNYLSFHLLNTSKLGRNRHGVVFSNYVSEIIPGTQVLYHGSEPLVYHTLLKNDARKEFSIPENCRIALSFVTGLFHED